MKSTPRVPGNRQIVAIKYKYNYRKFIRIIATEGDGSAEPGDPYLSRFPDNNTNISIHPVVFTHFIGRYLNACNEIENNNRMQKYDLFI